MTGAAIPTSGPRFGPTVLTGVLAAGLVSYAGSRAWVDIPAAAQTKANLISAAPVGEVPLVGALGLVTLAGWGVLLVTRGKVRRGLALFGVLAAVGAFVASVVGLGDVQDSAVADLAKQGYANAEVSLNLWGWISPVFALLCAAIFLIAFRAAPRWPEMGRKYDRPTHTPAAEVEGAVVADTSNLDLWKSLDQGQDPTL